MDENNNSNSVPPQVIPPVIPPAQNIPIPALPIAPVGSVELPHNPLPGEAVIHAAPASSGSGPKGHKKLFIIVGIVLTFVLLLGSAGGVLAAVAYDKISLNNPELEGKITQFVVGLPFMPKTPTYILESSAIVHSKHTKHAFNLSLSAEGNEAATSTLGLNKFDVEAKGDIDYTDPKNVMFSINASITKDFNIDIRKKDPIVYFKVNKIPELVYSYMNLEKAKVEPVLTQWVQYDSSSLDTAARRELDEQKTEGDSLTDEYLENTLDDMLAQNILEKMKISDEMVDGVSTYLFDLEADDKTIDSLVYRMNDRAEGKEDLKTLRTDEVKPSKYIKDLKLKIWIEKSSYLVRKVSTTFEYDQSGLYKTNNDIMPSRVLGVSTDVLGLESMMMGTGGAKYQIATVVSLSDFGKDITVELPAKSVKVEELYTQLMGAAGGGVNGSGGGPLELTQRSRDAVRLTDLANLQQVINVAVQESVDTNAQKVLCKSGFMLGKCSGNSDTGLRTSDGTGWIKADLLMQRSVSVPTLPVDPVNSAEYHYTYCSDGSNWEINTRLESEQQAPKMGNDGGDEGGSSDTVSNLLTNGLYEVGSNLKLIGPSGKCSY